MSSGQGPAGLRPPRVGARSRVRGVAPSGGCSPSSPRPPARPRLRLWAPPSGPPCPPSAGPLAAFAARPLAFRASPFGSSRSAGPPFAGPLSPLARLSSAFPRFGSAPPAVWRVSALARGGGSRPHTPVSTGVHFRTLRGPAAPVPPLVGGLLPPNPRKTSLGDMLLLVLAIFFRWLQLRVGLGQHVAKRAAARPIIAHHVKPVPYYRTV